MYDYIESTWKDNTKKDNKKPKFLMTRDKLHFQEGS